METTTKKLCTRQGCRKEYLDSENSNSACRFHDGKPIFHDVKKGWTCCNAIVYDWDEFMALVGCKEGAHSNDVNKGPDFFKSSAVDNAEKGLNKVTAEVKVKDIKAFEEEQKKIDEAKRQKESEKPKEVIKTSDGKFYCGNAGCQDKTYNPEDNQEGFCKHHSGQPVFHDRKKFWTCCKQEAYDWDDFMKLAACVIGKHSPKYKN